MGDLVASWISSHDYPLEGEAISYSGRVTPHKALPKT